jgi:hypothetical protein
MADAVQDQKQELAPSTPDIRVRRPQQYNAVSSSGLSESACVQPPHTGYAGHSPCQLSALPQPGAGAAETPYRRQPQQREHGELRRGQTQGDGDGARSVCSECIGWQRRYAMLQRRHVAEAAESAPARRAAVRALTQQLAEARGEVSSLAAELAQSRRACAALHRQLSAQSADPPPQPLRAVIPLDDYLDLTEATLLCAEQLRAMSLASSDSGSQLPLPMRHQHAAHLGDSGEEVVPQPSPGLASGKLKPAGMHDIQKASQADSEAASVASTEDSCPSWRACRGAAGVDSMLHALEAAIQSPGTPSTGLVPLTCSFSFLPGVFCQSGYQPCLGKQLLLFCAGACNCMLCVSILQTCYVSAA